MHVLVGEHQLYNKQILVFIIVLITNISLVIKIIYNAKFNARK